MFQRMTRNSHHFLSTLALLGATALLAAPAARAQTVYSNVASFSAAAPGSTVYGFENLAQSDQTAFTPNTSPLVFSVTGGNDTNYYGFSKTYVSGAYSLNGTDDIAAGNTGNATNPATTRINLGGTGATFTAFATEIGQGGAVTNNYVFALYLGNVQVGNTYPTLTNTPSDTFVGFTSTLPFDNVRVTTTQAQGVYTVFDNVRTGTAIATGAAAPEPGSVALLGASLLPLAGLVVQRSRARTAA